VLAEIMSLSCLALGSPVSRVNQKMRRKVEAAPHDLVDLCMMRVFVAASDVSAKKQMDVKHLICVESIGI
jgi:hypothetical protein